MSSIISKSNLEKIERLRQVVLKVGIWTLVGGVVLGALMILTAGEDVFGEVIGKLMGTIFIVALAMMISVNNFRRLVSDDSTVGTFALIGLVSNIVWAVLWVLILWNPEWLYTECLNYLKGGIYCERNVSMLAKLAIVSSLLSTLGFIGSNTMAMYEGNKRGILRPLKITTTACVAYETIYFSIMALLNFEYFSTNLGQRLLALAGFAGFVWWVLLIVAFVISIREKAKSGYKKVVENGEKARKYDETVGSGETAAAKTEAELRAEIEEKVRREIIEKEVREKLEAEKKSETTVPPMPGSE